MEDPHPTRKYPDSKSLGLGSFFVPDLRGRVFRGFQRFLKGFQRFSENFQRVFRGPLRAPGSELLGNASESLGLGGVLRGNTIRGNKPERFGSEREICLGEGL